MELFSEIANRIVKAQENVIGPLAVEQAKKVKGLTLDKNGKVSSVAGEKKQVLDQLIKQYEHLFGRASIEVCRDAVKGIIADAPKDQIPSVLLN